ncbi:hypothetical protein ACS0TY_007170 [Phlomoides rotata]
MLLVVANSQGDTTTFTYNSFSTSTDMLLYQGDAFVPSSSSFVRLTKVDASGQPERESIGRVVYAPPVKFWERGLQATFETTIRFIVMPGASGSVGDGFNFFIVPVNSGIPPESVDGHLRLFSPRTGNAVSVFAVEFDIAPNHAWDPTYQHIGIGINSRVSRNTSRFEN